MTTPDKESIVEELTKNSEKNCRNIYVIKEQLDKQIDLVANILQRHEDMLSTLQKMITMLMESQKKNIKIIEDLKAQQSLLMQEIQDLRG